MTTTNGDGEAMETKVEDFQDWDEATLLEVCSDTFTRLDGRLIARQRAAEEAGDAEAEEAWRAESIALWGERRAVLGADRDTPAAAILRWRARQDAVDAGGGPRIVAG